MFLILLGSFQALGCTHNLRLKAEVPIGLCSHILTPRYAVSGELSYEMSEYFWLFILPPIFIFNFDVKVISGPQQRKISMTKTLVLFMHLSSHMVTLKGRETSCLDCFTMLIFFFFFFFSL